MHDRELEKCLRAIREVAPPAELRARLVEGIPDSRQGRETGWIPERAWTMVRIAAAIVLLAGGGWLGTVLFMEPMAPLAHASMLELVWQATERPIAAYVVLNMRTRPNEDFPFVDPHGAFMRVEAWIESPTGDRGRVRIQKQDRTFTFDGTETVLYLEQSREAYRTAGRAIDQELFWPAAWVRRVRNLPAKDVEVVEHVENAGVGRLLVRESGVDTTPREPAFLGEFDRETEIEWDLASRRLTALRRWVYIDGERSLFSETESIEYLSEVDKATFAPRLPTDVRWGGVKKGPLSLLELGPRETAQRLFDAAAAGDRATLELLVPSPDMIEWLLDERNRPTSLFYLGDPFRAGQYAGVYVPYKVRFGAGPESVREHNLALRNDNAENRWVWDGGI